MRNSYRGALIVFIAVVFGLHASAQAGRSASCGRPTLPPNLDAGSLGTIVADMYDRSAAFRAQCDRIGAADTSSVSIRLDGWIPHSCRAFTVITRRGRSIDAAVHVPPSGTLLAELIGHEFEHVLEQLEGRDLRLLAGIRGFGVREIERDLFETDRAQRKGKIVADEVRNSRASHPSTD